MGWALENLGRAECLRIAEAAIAAAGGRVSQRSEERLSAHCPFPDHRDSNPSFGYNAEIDAYVCSCGRQGDLIDLWAELQGISEKREGFRAFKKRFGPDSDNEPGSTINRGRQEAADSSSQGQGPKMIPESAWAELEPLPEPWLKRLEESRGWSRETARALDLRLAVDNRGQERVAIPVRAKGGELLNIRLYRPGGGQSKVISWGKGFGLARLWPHPARWLGKETLWLTEGEPDCILALSLGLDAVTSTAGARAFKAHWADFFTGREVAIAYDNDRPGREGALKAARELAGTASRVRLVHWPDFMAEHQDLTDWFLTHGKTIGELRELLEDYEPGDDDPDDDELLAIQDGPGRFWVRGRDGRMSFRPALLAAEIAAEMELVTDRETGLSFRWTGSHFKPVNFEDLQKSAQTKLCDLATSARTRDAATLASIKSYLPEDVKMNAHPWPDPESGEGRYLLCLQNGMLDLDSGDMLPHDRKYLATYLYPWEFTPHTPPGLPGVQALSALDRPGPGGDLGDPGVRGLLPVARQQLRQGAVSLRPGPGRQEHLPQGPARPGGGRELHPRGPGGHGGSVPALHALQQGPVHLGRDRHQDARLQVPQEDFHRRRDQRRLQASAGVRFHAPLQAGLCRQRLPAHL